MLGSGEYMSGQAFRVSEFRVKVSDFLFRCFGFRGSGFESMIYDLGLSVQGFDFGVQGVHVRAGTAMRLAERGVRG